MKNLTQLAASIEAMHRLSPGSHVDISIECSALGEIEPGSSARTIRTLTTSHYVDFVIARGSIRTDLTKAGGLAWIGIAKGMRLHSGYDDEPSIDVKLKNGQKQGPRFNVIGGLAVSSPGITDRNAKIVESVLARNGGRLLPSQEDTGTAFIEFDTFVDPSRVPVAEFVIDRIGKRISA